MQKGFSVKAYLQQFHFHCKFFINMVKTVCHLISSRLNKFCMDFFIRFTKSPCITGKNLHKLSLKSKYIINETKCGWLRVDKELTFSQTEF